jgi:hypothetical protein
MPRIIEAAETLRPPASTDKCCRKERFIRGKSGAASLRINCFAWREVVAKAHAVRRRSSSSAGKSSIDLYIQGSASAVKYGV